MQYSRGQPCPATRAFVQIAANDRNPPIPLKNFQYLGEKPN